MHVVHSEHTRSTVAHITCLLNLIRSATSLFSCCMHADLPQFMRQLPAWSGRLSALHILFWEGHPLYRFHLVKAPSTLTVQVMSRSAFPGNSNQRGQHED